MRWRTGSNPEDCDSGSSDRLVRSITADPNTGLVPTGTDVTKVLTTAGLNNAVDSAVKDAAARVGIRLDRFVKNGLLRLISARTISGSAETYLVRIKALAREHSARCLVIDP